MDWSQVGYDVAAALLPVISLALTALIGLGSAYLYQRYAWTKESKAVSAIEDAMTSLIVDANQAIVDGIKAGRADGKLTDEEGQQIKADVLAKLNEQLTKGQKQVLAGITDDVTGWLEARLEKLLTDVKNEASKN